MTASSSIVRQLRKSLQSHALQVSVAVIVVLALALPASVAFLFELQQTEQRARKALQTDLERTAEVLAASLRNPLWELSIPTAEAIVRATAMDERLVSIVVTDLTTRQRFVELHRIAGEASHTVSVHQPIIRDGRDIGTVHTVMTLEPYLASAQAKLRGDLMRLVIVLLVALTLILWLLRKYLLKPIRQLTHEAHRIADEQLSAPIVSIGNNELGQVADAMEHMRRQLLETFGTLQEKHRQSLAIIEASPIPLAMIDAGDQIVFLNKAFVGAFGYAAAEIPTVTDWWRRAHPDANDYAWSMEQWQVRIGLARKTGTGFDPLELNVHCKDGSLHTVVCTAAAVEENFSGSHLIVLYDITERKRAEEKINALAFFDQLTGLANRTLLLDRLHQAMATGSRNNSFGAILFIDLDNFKVINDTLGHDVGDRLLQETAQRLLDCVREGDTVARMGGDEFVIMLTGLGDVLDSAAAHIEIIGEKILAVLQQSYWLNGFEHTCSASIGISLYQGHATASDELLKQADMAMYKAKEAGRNGLRFFDPAMESAVLERSQLDANLRTALAERQFLLYYQPQVLGDGRVTGAEALIRWQPPGQGMISPASFIPAAEETGLILPIGQWVLEAACQQLARWAEHPVFRELTLSVNVSARQFRQADFTGLVLDILERSGASPHHLKLELTESLLVTDIEETIGKMFTLKARGVGFSLDDFGTGYSSLSYLKRMPLDQLKIDQSFVRDVLVDPNDAAIASTVVALARSLGLGVIAEGVETEAQRAFLADSGCHAYQGYLFGRPLPLDDFMHYVEAHAVQNEPMKTG